MPSQWAKTKGKTSKELKYTVRICKKSVQLKQHYRYSSNIQVISTQFIELLSITNIHQQSTIYSFLTENLLISSWLIFVHESDDSGNLGLNPICNVAWRRMTWLAVILPKMHDECQIWANIWYTNAMKQRVLYELSDVTQRHMTSPIKKSCCISFLTYFLEVDEYPSLF